ncbi:hypothetical protein MC885_007075 [Smutsia gigantea]|nr:hypothetical protein MC885_007075 [Smutsia gigantea]
MLAHISADPLFTSDNEKCALDEARDSRMKRLLERYVPKHQKHLVSAQKYSTDPLEIKDAHQHKTQKFTSKSCIGFVCEENFNRQKPEYIKVDEESKEGLFINKEDLYEHYQKDSKNIGFGISKHKQSIPNQIYSKELRKNNLHNVKDSSTNVSKDKERRNTQYKRTQIDDTVQESNPRKTIAVSSNRKINRMVILDDLPESCKSFSPALSGLKNELGNTIKASSIPKDTHIQSLDLSDTQEIEFIELESVDQVEAVPFSGLSLHQEIEFPLVTADQQPYTYQEQNISLYKSHENRNSGQKDENLNKQENSFLSFVKENFHNDGDCFASENTVTSKKVMCSAGCKNHYNYKEITNREEMDFQQFLPSKDHLSQENELKTSSLTILPQQEAVTFSDLNNTVASEQHISNYEQCIYGTSFDHSHGNPEHTSLACTRTLSTHEISKFTGHVELFKRPQDYSPRAPASLINQTDTHIVEKVSKGKDTERNYTDKSQKPSSSSEPLSTVVHSQVIKTNEVEKRNQDLPESKIIHNPDIHSTDNMNEELTNISQLSQGGEREISHKPVEELIYNINGDESTIRNYEEKKDSEIHVHTSIQEHKNVQNFRKRQNFLKTTCNQGMKTAGINKRNARGKSQLHLSARKGNLSLVKALIESGANVNLKDNAGWTPLHEASSEGSNDIIVELLKAGANVNCKNLDGILPLHDAVVNNHLKAAEILLQHGANPNQKDQRKKTALDEADDEKIKELLKSYGAVETNDREESNTVVTVKIPAARPKKRKECFCDDCRTVDPPSLSHQGKIRESLPVHQTISAVLQAIKEEQENLLQFEIRTPEDAEQYIEKMLEIKEVMDNVLAKQKAERDDLAKKYRISIESFKQGALREQLANLATRQKSLLVVAKTQKKISQKIQNYKNVTSLSGLSLRKLPSGSEISRQKDSQELTSLENSAQLQSGSLSPVSFVCGSMQETQLSLEMSNNSQTTNSLNSETVRREDFRGNELNSKQDISDCILDGLSKSRHSNGTKKIKLASQPVAFIAQAEHSQKENDLKETEAKDHESSNPSAVTGTLNISGTTSVLAQNDAYSSTAAHAQAVSSCDPKRGNRKSASQQPPRRTSEFLARQGIDVLGSHTGQQVKPYLKKSAFAVAHANDSQGSSFSGSGCPHAVQKTLNYSTAPKKKCVQIKDLILLGRINPGNNILEFKTQVSYFFL